VLAGKLLDEQQRRPGWAWIGRFAVMAGAEAQAQPDLRDPSELQLGPRKFALSQSGTKVDWSLPDPYSGRYKRRDAHPFHYQASERFIARYN
jgi:hypothetical protein